MINDQAVRIGIAFAREAGESPQSQLCVASREILNVSGAGISIMSGTHTGPVCSTNAFSSELEDLQFTLGSGPCHDAFTSGAPVSETDLELDVVERWPGFSGRAFEMGLRSVFAYPIKQKEQPPFGVLTLYHDRIGALSPQQTRDGPVVAEILAETILSMQSRTAANELAAELVGAIEHRAEVHQASGMLAIQLSISVDEALVRLRAHAFSTGRSIADASADIVHRRLRLADDNSEDGSV